MDMLLVIVVCLSNSPDDSIRCDILYKLFNFFKQNCTSGLDRETHCEISERY